MDKGTAEYTVTTWSKGKTLVAGYRVKAPVLKLWGPMEISLLHLNSEDDPSRGVKHDLEASVGEVMAGARAGRMEIHERYAEFVQKLLTYHESVGKSGC